MALVALLSNPRSTGNKSLLPEVRSFCAEQADIFHYEVEQADQIACALKTIARVKPKVLVINGGDGTVQAALTELYQGGHFGDNPPPVAVLPNGKTNLIALDLGAKGSALSALKEIVEIARNDELESHIVVRQMIALSGGSSEKPVLGMFLGGAGLAEFILYCRHKIYPLGLPNGLSHVLAGIAGFISLLFKAPFEFLPRRSQPLRISLIRNGEVQGNYALLIVTTLEKLLLAGKSGSWYSSRDRLKFFAVDQNPGVVMRMIFAILFGRMGQKKVHGVHIEQGDEIRIDGDHSNVILDGELFEANEDAPIILRSTEPVPFLKIAA
ncbi:diacylglycerol kinase family protein [Sphingorhabdus sp. Alg239-R122]|uniref:diacylglycerol kinase family protein n=1 Tax=Sphingorhabdus sp. Alg239-R122 TaxID=2305989 RepID=UPI0013DB2D3E|nr:diacylglycerol kinase family protein [Sphingorhabdus sp. Alg239-R122]